MEGSQRSQGGPQLLRRLRPPPILDFQDNPTDIRPDDHEVRLLDVPSPGKESPVADRIIVRQRRQRLEHAALPRPRIRRDCRRDHPGHRPLSCIGCCGDHPTSSQGTRRPVRNADRRLADGDWGIKRRAAGNAGLRHRVLRLSQPGHARGGQAPESEGDLVKDVPHHA